MSEKKNNMIGIEQDSSNKQFRNALIVMAIFEAIVISAFVIYKLTR
jgi:hypothetical protein